jgi:hypothetical protein
LEDTLLAVTWITCGAAVTVRVATVELAAGLQVPLTVQKYLYPLITVVVFEMVSVAEVTPE